VRPRQLVIEVVGEIFRKPYKTPVRKSEANAHPLHKGTTSKQKYNYDTFPQPQGKGTA